MSDTVTISRDGLQWLLYWAELGLQEFGELNFENERKLRLLYHNKFNTALPCDNPNYCYNPPEYKGEPE